jgi:hypothetical protein
MLPGSGERSNPSGAGNRREDVSSRDQQLIATIEQMNLPPIQRTYLMERWLGQVRWLGTSARKNQRWHYGMRMIAILGGVTIPALFGLSVNDSYQDVIRWITSVLGLVVAAAVATEEFFLFGERWRLYRRQAELLRSEGWAYLSGSGATYRRQTSPEDAFRTFAARCEEMMRQEVGKYVSEVVRGTEPQRGEDASKAELRKDALPKEGDD